MDDLSTEPITRKSPCVSCTLNPIFCCGTRRTSVSISAPPSEISSTRAVVPCVNAIPFKSGVSSGLSRVCCLLLAKASSFFLMAIVFHIDSHLRETNYLLCTKFPNASEKIHEIFRQLPNPSGNAGILPAFFHEDAGEAPAFPGTDRLTKYFIIRSLLCTRK